MELRTCAVPSMNSLHTNHHEPKFVGFFSKHKEKERELDAPGVLCSTQVRRKLINRTPSTNCLVRLWFAGVYRALVNFLRKIWLKILGKFQEFRDIG